MQDGTLVASSSRLALEHALSRYAYTPYGRDDAVECMEFGSMVDVFLRMTSTSGGLPPKQRQFSLVVVHSLGLPETSPVYGRAGRTWASFVVQWHAKVSLEERYPLVIWHREADQRYGLDLIVFTSEWMPVGLALRVPGAAGAGQAARKNGHHSPTGLVVREVVCDPKEHRVGPFWLIATERLVDAVEDAACEARFRQCTANEQEMYAAGYEQAIADAGREA